MIIEKQKRYRCTRVLNFMVKNGNTYHTTRLGGIYNGIIILDCILNVYWATLYLLSLSLQIEYLLTNFVYNFAPTWTLD